MAVVIGSASIRITAISKDLKRDIGRDLNTALRDVKVDINPLQGLDEKLRRSELELIKARQSVAKFEREAVEAEKALTAARKDSTSTAEAVREAELRLARAQAETSVARDKVRSITLSIADSQNKLRASLQGTREETVKVDRDTNKLRATMTGLHGITRGLGVAFSFLLPSIGQVRIGAGILTTTLGVMTKATAVALAGQAALAGAGGLLAVAGALSQAAGAALLIPAALGAGVITLTALTVGFQGMGDALKSVGDPAKFGEAIKGLAPSAREFAVAVKGSVPAFKELRLQVQDRLFQGLGKDFTELAQIHIPIVQRGLVAMAGALNEGAKGFASFARDKQTVSDLGTLFDNSALGAHSLATAMQPILSALRDIGTVASSFLPGLAGGFAGAAIRFGEFVDHARDSGQLKEFIGNGIAAAKDIGGVLANVGGIIGGVLRAGRDAGAGFLDTAKSVTGELREWVKGAQGQAALGRFFAAAKEAGGALMPILGSVIQLVGKLAPILSNIAVTVGPSVALVLDSIGQALDVAAPGIGALAAGFASFMAAVAPALPAIGNLVSVLGTGLGQVLVAIGPVLAKVATVLSGQLASAIPLLVPAVIAIATAFGNVAVALAPLIPSLISLLGPFTKAGGIIDHIVPIIDTLVTGFGDLVDIASPLIDLIGDSLIGVLDGVEAILPDLVTAFLDLVKAATPIVEAILPPLVDLFKQIVPVLPPIVDGITFLVQALSPVLKLIGPVIEALATLIGWIVGALEKLADIGTGFLEVIGAADIAQGGFVKSTFSFADASEQAFGRVGKAIGVSTQEYEAWGTKVADTAGGAIGSMAGFATGTSSAMSDAVKFVSNGLKLIRDLFHGMSAATGAAGSSAGLSFSAGLSGGLGSAVGVANNVAGQIGSALRRDYGAAGSAIIDSLAAGMRRSIPEAVAAARAATGAIAGFLPRSPALVGPFSGQGWTLFRGMALIDGLAEGIKAATPSLLAPTLAATQVMSTALLNGRGVPSSALPPVLPRGAPPVPGGDGASLPDDLFSAIVEAINGWQVIVSARAAASKVNRVNQENQGR